MVTHPAVARAQEAHDRWTSANAALRQAPSDESLIAERDAAWSAYRACFVECDDIEVRCDQCGILANWCDIEHVGEPCAECRQRKPRQLAIGQRHIVGDLRITARDVSAPATTATTTPSKPGHALAAITRGHGTICIRRADGKAAFPRGEHFTARCSCGWQDSHPEVETVVSLFEEHLEHVPEHLIGRKAKCRCGETRPSARDLGMFQFRGEGSDDASLCRVCGCYASVHTPGAVIRGCEPHEPEPIGPREFDSFWCGCGGTD